MLVHTILPRPALEGIARRLGIRIVGTGGAGDAPDYVGRSRTHPAGETARKYRLGLRPNPLRTPTGRISRRDRSPYWRVSAAHFTAHRRISAVCWHGYRDFLRALFDADPGAVVQTSVAHYHGVEDFERKFPGTEVLPLGPYGFTLGTACNCDPHGRVMERDEQGAYAVPNVGEFRAEE